MAWGAGGGEAEWKRRAGCFGVLLPLEAQAGGPGPDWAGSRLNLDGLGASGDVRWQLCPSCPPVAAAHPPAGTAPSHPAAPAPLWPNQTPQAAHTPPARTPRPRVP